MLPKHLAGHIHQPPLSTGDFGAHASEIAPKGDAEITSLPGARLCRGFRHEAGGAACRADGRTRRSICAQRAMSSRRAASLTCRTLWSSQGEAVKSDVWSMVHAARAALIDDLTHLDEGQWETPSLCEGWTVHDVVAHLVDTARTTRLGFVVEPRPGAVRLRPSERPRCRARARWLATADVGAASSGGVTEVDPSGTPRQPARRGGRPR